MILTQVTPGDLKTLQLLASETFADTYAALNTPENMERYLEEKFNDGQLHRELTDPNSFFYFVSEGDEILGYLKLNTGASQTEPQDPRAVELERIYIRKEHQGRQLGVVLFEKAVEVARELNAPYLWLGVWEENPKAYRFYQRMGLVPFDSHVFKLGDDEQTDILMKMEL
ncbi:GNAT family N-acetyltransferase [Siphonobacter aquaeclarae]|uniref:Ribosomal protein S18 acetylase RimI n=1 Tax=Siphonobacter aquaeclarae TaxID=563176 RepID=A0A1G9RNA0_9BACT|nr:GNAT family N-acetyltransferase [Siphonobacter aquaeclarae]SDM24693.1 Ribosomal protein S18 acetylase RimI [Siphonobacter aquaeclarae]